MAIKFESREDKLRYYRNHRRVARERGRVSNLDCLCGRYAQVWAQLHGTSGDDPGDFMPMCYWCHHSYDAFTMYGIARNEKVSDAAKKMWAESTPEKRLSMQPDNKGRSRPDMIGNKFTAGKRNAAGKRTPEQCERIRIGRWGR